MKVGLLTSVFPDLTLTEIAGWAAEHGFDTLEVACWPAGSDVNRRYAGVSHIDVADLDDHAADLISDCLRRNGLAISALAYYPNPLDPDPRERAAVDTHLRRVIQAARKLEVDTVCTFVGNDKQQTPSVNLDRFGEVWPPLVQFAADYGVRIAIENCPMIFSYDEWPGGNNLAYCPAHWREMFGRIPDPNFGLNLDPSHLLWQMIDIPRSTREFGARIFHVHGKDLEVSRQGLYEHGVMSTGIGWAIPRLCGLGEVDWKAFIAALRAVGYDGALSIEHEDRDFEGALEVRQKGLLIARDSLRAHSLPNA